MSLFQAIWGREDIDPGPITEVQLRRAHELHEKQLAEAKRSLQETTAKLQGLHSLKRALTREHDGLR